MPERFTRPAILAGLRREFDRIRASDNPKKAREEWLGDTRAKMASLFRGREELAAPVMERIEGLLRENNDAFPQIASDMLGSVFEAMYANPEAAERFYEHLRAEEREGRERTVETANAISLSPEHMLYGKLDEDDDTTFRIHVGTAFTLEPNEKLVDFRKGMRELARRLREDPSLANVKEIVGTSWLVGEHPNVARRMGFRVDEEPLPPEAGAHYGGDTRKIQRSWMTREELIAKYGTNQASG